MNAIDIINKTKKSIELSDSEIKWLVKSYTDGVMPDYQMSAWLMAVCINGLTEREILSLTYAMRDSGKIMDLGIGMTADKHSTGGVGDKTSLIVGPAAAACGVTVAKMSGRGLGHTGGTIDKLESIPGFRTDLSVSDFKKILKETGFAIISQNEELCPADKKIYALRNSTATVDSIPLICASIMSKKLAMNADCLVFDVKYGSGAFMKTRSDAEKLACLMEKIGSSAGKRCKAVVTDMESPLGKSIGNALEVKEAVEVLHGKVRGRLYDTCIELTAAILELAGKGENNEACKKLAEEAITSGRALETFRKTIALQGGNPEICDNVSLLPSPAYKYKVKAAYDMKITGFNCEEIGMVSLLLGAGRISKDEQIDMSAGIEMNADIGSVLSAGDTIMTLYSSVRSDFSGIALRALNAVDYQYFY